MNPPEYQNLKKTNQLGVTLLISVVVLSAIFSISIGMFNLVFVQIVLSGESADSFRAFFASDQGTEALLYRHRVLLQPLCPISSTCDPVTGFENVDVGGGACYRISMIQSADTDGNGAADLTTLISRGEYRCGGGGKRQVFRAVELAYGGPPSGPPPQVCGNGSVESGEQCDRGASNGVCPAVCSTSCTFNSCGVCTPGEIQIQGCTTAQSCPGTETRSCQADWTWGGFGICIDVPGDGCPVSPVSPFALQDAFGSNVASVNAAGNFVLKGALEQSSTRVAGANDFVVQDSAGNNIAIIDRDTGNMYIDGVLSENVNPIPPSTSVYDFAIETVSGELVVLIKTNGDLVLKGTLTPNGSP